MSSELIKQPLIYQRLHKLEQGTSPNASVANLVSTAKPQCKNIL